MAMSPRLLRPRATGFNPAQISGIADWWDAADAATITLNAGAVETWSSKAGLRNAATQATANNRPTTTTANGKTAVYFDGVNDGLDFSGTARADETWIVAFAQLSAQSGQRMVLAETASAFGLSVTQGGSAKFIENSWGNFTEGSGRMRVNYAAGASVVAGPLVASTVRSAASGLFVFVDGTQRSSAINGATNGTASSSLAISRIGCFSSAQLQLDGWIGEIVCYNRPLTAAERSRVERYMGRKWGITVA